MNIAFLIQHPAQVHKFAFLIKKLQKRHNIYIGAIEKEITKYLLDHYGIEYELLGKNRKSKLAKIIFLLKHEMLYLTKMLKFKPDLLIGSGELLLTNIAMILRKPYLVFDDSEHYKIIIKSYLPHASKILTPDCFRMDLGQKQIRYKGYHELAYLHPNYFKPNPAIFEYLGLKEGDKYFLIRKTAGIAVENIGQTLMSDKDLEILIKKLEKYGKVFLSYEKKHHPTLQKYMIKIKPEYMHSVLYYANMVIGDTLTMFTESAVLGTPVISISTEGFQLGNFDDICEKYKLGFRFKTLPEAFSKIDELLNNPNLKEEWKIKRENLLKDKIDVTQFWYDFVENYIEHNIKNRRE